MSVISWTRNIQEETWRIVEILIEPRMNQLVDGVRAVQFSDAASPAPARTVLPTNSPEQTEGGVPDPTSELRQARLGGLTVASRQHVGGSRRDPLSRLIFRLLCWPEHAGKMIDEVLFGATEPVAGGGSSEYVGAAQFHHQLGCFKQ